MCSSDLLWAAERQAQPEPAEREAYRLTMLQERLAAWSHEQKRAPERLFDFADSVAEVPWLSTCDPWGHGVAFTPRGTEYDLRSAGPDGFLGSPDDIVRTGLLKRGDERH